MAKRLKLKLKNAKAVKAGSKEPKNIGGILNRKVVAIVTKMKGK